MTDPKQSPDKQLDALFAAARARRPDTSRAEYAFETRLAARLRDKSPDAASIWAMASWRLMPFFAVVVIGLTFLQAHVSASAQDAEQSAYAQNPAAGDLWSNFN